MCTHGVLLARDDLPIFVAHYSAPLLKIARARRESVKEMQLPIESRQTVTFTTSLWESMDSMHAATADLQEQTTATSAITWRSHVMTVLPLLYHLSSKLIQFV